MSSDPIALPALIKEIGRGAKGARDLSMADAERLLTAILAGQVPDLELGAILLSLRIKSESDDELVGFCHAMQATTRQLKSIATPLIILPSYNGVRRQPNLLPLLAFLLRDAGLPVVIHGRHDFDNRENPFPLFHACGIPAAGSLEEINQQIVDTGIALTDIELLNPALNRLLALRSRLGLRNSAHTLCKLLDPCPGHTVRVVNVTHPEYLIRMGTLLEAQQATALLMRGTEGEAFANPRRRPELLGFQHGEPVTLFPAEAGGTPPIPGWPETADFKQNIALIQSLREAPDKIPQPLLDQVTALKTLARQ
ncbi:MAG: DNA-binding protein YbiB [Pseudomonadota bacterium]|jgi:anthranilate phosphoribosyltransferase